jgi:hypothetical protein
MSRRVALVGTDVSEELRATRRNILEDAILQSHRRENLKSYIHSGKSHKHRFDSLKPYTSFTLSPCFCERDLTEAMSRASETSLRLSAASAAKEHNFQGLYVTCILRKALNSSRM